MKIQIEIPDEFIEEYLKDQFTEKMLEIYNKSKDNCSKEEVNLISMLLGSLRESDIVFDRIPGKCEYAKQVRGDWYCGINGTFCSQVSNKLCNMEKEKIDVSPLAAED